LKIISPENLVGQTESEKIRNINKTFEDAYKTTNACIVVDCIERLIDYSPIGRRFSNNILQTLLLLIEKSPPKEENKLLIIGTTSAYYNMQQLDITPCFDIKYSSFYVGSKFQTYIMTKFSLCSKKNTVSTRVWPKK